MKYLFTLSLLLSFFYSQSQGYTAVRNISEDIIRLKPSVNKKADSTTLYFDDKGTALSYIQFNKLLISGEYVAKPADEASSPRKIFLKRLSTEAYQKLNSFIRNNTRVDNDHISIGKKIDLTPLHPYLAAEKLANKIIVQVYWYNGCKSCDEVLAGLSSFVKELGHPDNLTFIVMTNDDLKLLNKKLKDSPISNAEILADAKPIADSYEITEYPAYIVSDRNQLIQYAAAGSSRLTIPDLKDAIRAALSQ